ncbi:uncharacterized protein PV09_02828 [Verruconis gallopava]|uniref:Uncharacterized protein n=1 Tax=Verruconis gallopava TaxID=253628 RepID=A0A0D1Z081_9PEZI|nr:uncharacterized protein PV09_02828 [Verruconis gallopava]KIW06372.1 hypothetical protein PV09_02828 [Verruconis gallopava]
MRAPRSLSRRFSDAGDSTSSASTSPERGAIDDDNDSLMIHENDSASSLTPSEEEDISDSLAQEMAERFRVSPISKLPAELMICIFQKMGSASDLKNCMLVSKEWARNSVGLLWHRPQTGNWAALQCVIKSLRCANAAFDYPHLVKRLNLSSMGVQVSDGTLQPFQNCKRIERLTLTGCQKLSDLSLVKMVTDNRSLLALDVTAIEGVTDYTMNAVARNCFRLQGLNITSCRKITDDSLINIAHHCRHLKRLKFNECRQLTANSIIEFARNCKQLLEIDLHGCSLVEDDAVTALISEGSNLRELRLAHCSRITDAAFLNLPFERTFETLRILDLTDCGELQDNGVIKIIAAAPRLRNLVLAKCKQITDRAVLAITKLGKNLHYIHLGHCQRITDTGVIQLVRFCTRIRYIDLACCTNLTDNSVTQLAHLPKLKRIGLVKCNNITDRSIYALAKPKQSDIPRGPLQPSSLERVHLSYCTQLTIEGVTALLNNCPRLTHLSLTGVQAFLHDEFTIFCRDPPPEFNDHQRDVFCVFSNSGVSRLRDYLNQNANPSYESHYDVESTMYEDDENPSLFNSQNDMMTSLPGIGPHHVIHMPPIPPHPQPVTGHGHYNLQPPQPSAPSVQQFPFQHADDGSPTRPDLPPLVIPAANPGSPNAMSPTNDAPLTIDDEEVQFGSDNEETNALHPGIDF